MTFTTGIVKWCRVCPRRIWFRGVEPAFAHYQLQRPRDESSVIEPSISGLTDPPVVRS